jgi:prolyl oligopeptidase
MPLQLSIAALLLTAAHAAAQLPTIAPGTTTDTFFGTAVSDPYRRLEDTKDKAVAAWMKAHSEHAHRTLVGLPQRAALLASIKKYDDAASARVVDVIRTSGGRLFYSKRGVADDQFKLYTRDAQGRETLLVDPATFAARAGSKPHAINWFSPSPDGRRVAYGVSAAGSESATLYVIDVASRRTLGSPIPRADFGGATWTEDAGRLYFVQLQALAAGASPLEKYRNSRVVWVTPGARALPRAVLGPGTPGVQIAPEEIPFLALSADGRYAFAFVINGVQREQRVYAADQRAFIAGKPAWKLLHDRDAQIVGGAYAQGTLYALTYKDAPRYKLIAGPVDGFDPAKATTVIAAGDKVLTGVAAAADAIYIEQRDGNVKRLAKLAHARDGQVQSNATPTPVPLPVDGAFVLNGDEGGAGAADPRLPGLLIDLQGWTRARQIYSVAADGSVRNTGLQPAGPYDAPQDLVTTELQCKSHDGALVPMSVIHKKGLVLDGKQPTLLYGYASYGITEEPFFSTGRLAWLDAGGVSAIANPRGTSVYGQDWYKAGFQATKANTWKDFIACAETLIAQKYTSPAHLGILGGSAGGILVGRAMTERPDLFGAVIAAVGDMDMVRTELTPNGVPNIPEFGTHTNEAGFRALLAMSSYHQVKDGVKYPAVLLNHGVNDPRVEVWHSSKMAARLLAASTSGKPVLLRLDYDAGHGVGSTKAQQQAERADMYAFLLWQLGGGGK